MDHGIKVLKVELWNIKDTEHRIIEFNSEKTIIQGDNSVGKSTIDQAIAFCFFGGKKDVDLIKKGQDRAMVRVWCEVFHMDKYVLRKFEVNINREGAVQCAALDENNIPLQNPRQLIKTYANPQIFDPLSILNNADYKNNILKIVDVRVDKEEFESLNLSIPTEKVNFNSNGIDILLWAEKLLTKERRPVLHREVQRTKGAYNTAFVKISERTDAFQKKYNKEIDEVVPSEKIMKDRLRYQNSLDEIRNNFSEKKLQYDNQEGKVVAIKKRITSIEVEISELNERLLSQGNNLLMLKKELDEADKHLNQMIRPDSEGTEESLLNEINHLLNEEAISKEAESIKNEKENIIHKKEDWDKAIIDYKHLDEKIIKETFFGFKTKKMKEVEALVPGLTVEEDGDLLWEGKRISTLSDSERLALAIQLQSKVQPEDSTIFIKVGEIFDDSTIQKINIPQRLVIIRVGKSEVPGFDCQTLTKQHTEV